MNVIEIHELTKNFGSTRALNGVSMSVERGAICGLLGPNGAGKTTLLRIINAIMTADAGTVMIDGVESSIRQARRLGYLPEERGLYDNMRVEDQIRYFGELKGGNPGRVREVMEEYLSLFGLDSMKRRRIKELSKGNRQKVQIISTLVHEPEIVILDEPFSGFDPINGEILRGIISRLHAAGTTVMLSSHNMPAIEEMCSDIILLHNGDVLLSGKLDDIKDAHRKGTIMLTMREPADTSAILECESVSSIAQADTKSHRKGASYRIGKTPGASNSSLIEELSRHGEIVSFEEELPSLNDIFIHYTSKSITP